MLPGNRERAQQNAKYATDVMKELAAKKKKDAPKSSLGLSGSNVKELSENKLNTKETLDAIKSFVSTIDTYSLILPKLQPIKFKDQNHPYTMIGKGLKGFHFIKELKNGKFVNKKIERVGETVISGLSNFLTGIDKKRNISASKRIVKKQLSPAEIMNFMTVTYLEE